MTIVRNDTHVQQALDTLLEQFKDQPNIAGLLTSYITEVQSVEDALCDLADKQNLDLADGGYLDLIGDIEGVTRGGQSDDTYRANIRRVISLRTDAGTVNDLINFVGVKIPNDYVKLVIAVLLVNVDALTASQKLALLQSVVAAGVQVVLINPPPSGLGNAWIVGGSGPNSVGNGHVASVVTE